MVKTAANNLTTQRQLLAVGRLFFQLLLYVLVVNVHGGKTPIHVNNTFKNYSK